MVIFFFIVILRAFTDRYGRIWRIPFIADNLLHPLGFANELLTGEIK